MKEFVEKLIERLDELQEIEGKKCDEYAKLNMGDYVEKYNHGECCYIKAIQIVNQLAEEYKKEPYAIYETIRSNRLDCEVPSDCFEQIKEVRVIDEWTEESKVFNQECQGWIPVAERLPENKGEYLITTNFGVTSALYLPKSKKWVDTIEQYFEYSCVAWQSLPEPYKPKEQQEEV